SSESTIAAPQTAIPMSRKTSPMPERHDSEIARNVFRYRNPRLRCRKEWLRCLIPARRPAVPRVGDGQQFLAVDRHRLHVADRLSPANAMPEGQQSIDRRLRRASLLVGDLLGCGLLRPAWCGDGVGERTVEREHVQQDL